MFNSLRRITTATAAAALGLSALMAPSASAITGGYTPDVNSTANAVVYIGVPYNMCTGVMIGPSTALTAQHCTDLPLIGQVDVIAPIQPGIHRDAETYVGTVTPHPVADLAIVTLNGVHDGTCAKLPTGLLNRGDDLTAVGFGGGNLASAQAVDMYLHKRLESVQPGHPADKVQHFITPRYHETTDRGALRYGDSGGPLLAGNEVHGIFSWGRHYDDLGFMNVHHVEVAPYLDWIEDVSGIDTVGTDVALASTTDASFNIDNPTPCTTPEIQDNGPQDKYSGLSSAVAGSSADALTWLYPKDS